MELMLPLEAEAILATEEKVLLLLLPMLLRDGAMTAMEDILSDEGGPIAVRHC